ncbi:MAG: hypothetical protein ABMA26_11805 [Limisphaerales bacterium]
MSDIIEEGLLRQFNVNPTSIERWILLGVLRSIRFYRSIRQNVCARQTDGRLRQDFLTPRYNQLYAAADRFWRLLDRSSMDRDMEIPRHLLATLLQDDLELGKLDEPDYRLLQEEMEQVFYSMPVVPAPLLKGIHGPLKVWLDMMTQRQPHTQTGCEISRVGPVNHLTNTLAIERVSRSSGPASRAFEAARTDTCP